MQYRNSYTGSQTYIKIFENVPYFSWYDILGNFWKKFPIGTQYFELILYEVAKYRVLDSFCKNIECFFDCDFIENYQILENFYLILEVLIETIWEVWHSLRGGGLVKKMCGIGGNGLSQRVMSLLQKRLFQQWHLNCSICCNNTISSTFEVLVHLNDIFYVEIMNISA